MVIFSLLILLFVSFTLHFFSLIFYLLNKTKVYFNLFFGTALLNILLGIFLSIYALKNPGSIRGLNISFLLWIVSGLIMFLLLSVKIGLTVKIYKRSKDPDFFHYNFFNKKVYNEKLVKQHETMIFFITIPFFLIIGAYFTARIINLLLYGHL